LCLNYKINEMENFTFYIKKVQTRKQQKNGSAIEHPHTKKESSADFNGIFLVEKVHFVELHNLMIIFILKTELLTDFMEKLCESGVD
jgi:hypothetical protein